MIAMATRKKSAPATEAAPAESTADAVSTVKHRATRKNIPPADLEARGRVEDEPRVRLDHNPNLPQRLRFADALRRRERWLDWAGWPERPWTEVEALALCPTSRNRIAAWFVDTDYDSRTFLHLPGLLPRPQEVGQAGPRAGRQGRRGRSAVRRADRLRHAALRAAAGAAAGQALSGGREGDRPARQRGPARSDDARASMNRR
jgi:hypothetical protein